MIKRNLQILTLECKDGDSIQLTYNDEKITIALKEVRYSKAHNSIKTPQNIIVKREELE